MLIAAVHGFILALGLILPIGMQNGFILTQGVVNRRWTGALPAVITASVCDTVLVSLAVLGLSAVALHIFWLRYILGMIGIGFLLYMGWKTWQDKGSMDQDETSTAWPPKRQVTFAASVSLFNPHALIDTLVILGGSALAYTSWADKIAFASACSVVSWIWFFFLAIGGHIAGKAALRSTSFNKIHQVAAVMMWLSAIYLAYIIYTFQ
ncbi:LysE/ArgO family amino acid transporter [Alicyclobacillus tolerans]|uniref:LysE/ArgO family amino acid transporter n=1 Tax=Alicyclobacillus tolerans TaxID=90970 RepID=UPI003B7D988C